MHGQAAYLDMWQASVPHCHNGAILGPGSHLKLLWARLPVYDQAVIPCRLEGVWQALDSSARSVPAHVTQHACCPSESRSLDNSVPAEVTMLTSSRASGTRCCEGPQPSTTAHR